MAACHCEVASNKFSQTISCDCCRAAERAYFITDTDHNSYFMGSLGRRFDSCLCCEATE